MSKIRNLPETTLLEDNDLLYAVDVSEGPNGGKKITKANLKESVKQSASEIKTEYESNPDTNAFTDAEKSKLAGIETGATADQNALEVPYDNTDSGLSATNVKEALDEVSAEAQADFRPSIVSGRILHYTGGTARFDDVFYQLVAGDILLDPNITLGEVYVDLDGLVKQTGSGVTAPPLSIVFARFSTDLNDIISLIDERVKNTQNLVRGDVSNVRDVRAGAAASAGNSGRLSDAEHKHNILTDTAVTLNADSANSEGTSISLARADHTHDLGTGIPSTQTPDQANAEGSSANLARADHTHNIPAEAPTTNLSPATTNAEGIAASFARSDHAHAVETGLVGDITTIQPNAAASAGTADRFARGDHRHAIATATAVELTDSTNAEGASTSFARADHTHAHGNRGGGSLHSAVTTSVNGFMSASDKTKLDALVFGFLSYSNSANQTTTQTNTAFTAVTLDTDTGSFANSLLTKTSATQFRTDFNGYIRITIKVLAQNVSTNDQSWRAAVLKNASVIPHTEIRSTGKTNKNRYGSAAGSFLIPCATNDLFTLGYSNAEAATNSITIFTNGASFNIQAIYKTS